MTTTVSRTIRLLATVAAGIALALGLCLFATNQEAFAAESLMGGKIAGDLSAQSGDTLKPAGKTPHVEYSAHVQLKGWMKSVQDGETAGTTGKGLRLEAFKVSLSDKPASGSIKYRAYVEKSGWSDWSVNGAVAGTTGKALRLEAIQIQLTGKMAKKYDVYYRVHVQELGWLDWAKNGGSAGTGGENLRIEAMEVQLVKKGGSAPGKIDKSFVSKYFVNYSVYVQTLGWKKDIKDGNQAGTTGAGLRLEAFAASVADLGLEGNIIYSAHIAGQGWCNWRANGETVGAAASNRAIEAVKIDLTHDLAAHYDVYYRVHSQQYGWLGWAKNSAVAGTVGYGYRAEAIQVMLVPEGAKAPGPTANPSYIKK